MFIWFQSNNNANFANFIATGFVPAYNYKIADFNICTHVTKKYFEL